MKTITKRLGAAALLGTLVGADLGADENLLGYTKGAETLPQGASEAYLYLTEHSGKRRGDYSAQYVRAEYEYGVTDRLSTSIYLNGYRHNYDCGTQGCAGSSTSPEITGSKNQFRLSGVSMEAKYMMLSPYADDLGVALYGELTYDTVDSITGENGNGLEAEMMVIFQKPFMDGQFQWMTNLELEIESWKGDGAGGTEYAMAPRIRSGVSYRFAPNWYIGAEGWADVEMLNPVGSSWEFDHWDMFAGPSIHYGDKAWWATVTWANQIAGSDESRNNAVGWHLADHERNEFRLKVGYNF